MNLKKKNEFDNLYLDYVTQQTEEIMVANPIEKPKKKRGRPLKYPTRGESQKLATQKYLEKHPFKVQLNTIKDRCLKKGIEFDLKEEDIEVPEVCPILGIPLTTQKGQGVRFNTASIDRLDPTRGYTKDNIWVISFKANLMKNDANVDELRSFANWVIETYGTFAEPEKS